MSTVISSDKHYRELASKVRTILGTTIEYKPSEMSSSIVSIQNIIDEYNSIENGFICYGESAIIRGSKMLPGMFYRSNIKSFVVPENITEIPDYAFEGSDIENITLHDNITSIGEYCFEHCANLTAIKLPSNLVSIGDSAFSLTYIKDKLIIPSSVTSIGSMAFSTSDFTHIDIPSGVSTICSYLFSNCEYLETVILRRTSSVCSWPISDPFADSMVSSGTGYIYVPSALVNSYKTASGWSTYASQFRAIEDYPDICG
jgi:hypothetical protein